MVAWFEVRWFYQRPSHWDPTQIQIRGYELTIRREDAQRIEIRKEEAV